MTSQSHASAATRLSAIDAVVVPEAVTPHIAPLARLMGVTMTTLITTTARAGDRVMVTGLGPVGYLGTQVFRRGGFEVLCWEVALVGVPWQRRTDIPAHTLLEKVFNNYVVVRSGWEWELPVHETFRFQDHTLQQNYATALEWLADGSIYTEGLCHIVSPRDCQQAYQDCLHHPTKGLFTLFDWTALGRMT